MAAYTFSTASGSTTSGTYSSTTYKSSRGSVVSCESDLASQLSRIDLSFEFEFEDDEGEVKKIERAKRLVKEFCHGDGDISAVVEGWLSELGVGWVLGLRDDASAGASLLLRGQRILTENWIQALNEITGSTLRFVRKQDMLAERDVLGPFQLVFKETVLKMLPFVDALLAAADPLDDAATDTADVTNGAQALSAEKLQTLLDVHDALSSPLKAIKLYFRNYSAETETHRSSDEVLSLLSAKAQRLDEAIWNSMKEFRTSIQNDDDDNEWGIQTPQGSPGICKVTRSLVTYIKSMCGYHWLLDHIVRTSTAAEQDKTDPFTTYFFPDNSLTTFIMEMVSSLEVKLDKRSESFPDHSLRFLFLINNTHFIWQQLHPVLPMTFHILTIKIEDYIQKYLQVSWEPVLSCLHNETPRCFRTNSTLPKFDSEFQKTYTAQKLWKVPDPELRTRLRKAIVKKVVSGFTKYLEDNNITNPGITPQEREEMLLDLFEG